MAIMRACNTMCFTGLKRLKGNSEHVDALAEFYENNGMRQAKNEAHAEELLAQGVHCFIIEGNDN